MVVYSRQTISCFGSCVDIRPRSPSMSITRQTESRFAAVDSDLLTDFTMARMSGGPDKKIESFMGWNERKFEGNYFKIERRQKKED